MLQKALDLVRLDFAPAHGQPSGARLALVTYHALVRLAPVRALARHAIRRPRPTGKYRTLTEA